MSFHQDQIKKKLLELDIDSYRYHERQSVKPSKKVSDKNKKYPHSELSEWATNQKTTTFTSFPYLQFASQNIRKNKIMSNTPNQMSSYFTKSNFRYKDQTSMVNPINLSFNPQQTKKYKSKNKRESYLLHKQDFKIEEKKLKESLEMYLINGQIKMNSCQKKQIQNGQNRSSHLLKLLRQRQILRRKRYSFDIDSGFMTKGYFNP